MSDANLLVLAAAPQMFLMWVLVFVFTAVEWGVTCLAESLRRSEELVMPESCMILEIRSYLEISCSNVTEKFHVSCKVRMVKHPMSSMSLLCRLHMQLCVLEDACSYACDVL